MSTVNAQRMPVATPTPAGGLTFAGRNGVVHRYFYFAMSLALAALVVTGFSRTVNANLLHAAVPRPRILWFHATAFTSWVLFFILQATLVRVHKVSWHRLLGWFGATLAAVMVPLGVTTSIVMTRFHSRQLHETGLDAFLSIPFYDMLAFGVCVGLAIYWRKQPELHRRLMFIATCTLMDAAFARFDFMFDHSLFLPAINVLILLGVARDLLVDRRVHKVYLYALPLLFVGQGFAVYLWRINPAWWQQVTKGMLG